MEVRIFAVVLRPVTTFRGAFGLARLTFDGNLVTGHSGRIF